MMVQPSAWGQKAGANLESLIRQSGMIFSGKVIAVETGSKEKNMNLYMTSYTFRIDDPIYGVEGDTIRIKQYGGESNGRKFYPAGVPRFQVGEEVLVMLYPPSAIGMTSTVGKDQGKFWIEPGDSVTGRTVKNKLENKGLFRKLSHPELVDDPDWITSQPSQLEYDKFVDTVRKLASVVKKNGRK